MTGGVITIIHSAWDLATVREPRMSVTTQETIAFDEHAETEQP
ncbi:hypothetical protein RRSWK_05934 [Rhodopirellula sp. SWK7]|nr:hypothetical protein RRSWK_05934 [Rhodopirellula sp. SWK7]